MPTVVVPYRATGKSRLPACLRVELGRAMLEDVVAAARPVGRVLVVTDDAGVVPRGASSVADTGGGHGAAVAAALAACDEQVLVVNADLPLATPAALERLIAAGDALVAAADGTTNALSLRDASRFRPLYGPGSAARFAAIGLVQVTIPELEHDVDTLADLDGIELPLGRRTRLVTDRYRAERAGVAR